MNDEQLKPKTGSTINIGGGLLGGLTNIAGQLIQNRMNKKMAEYQYQKDTEMWNKMNEYNDPKNQMARLQAAGLNPHLVYGGGSATTQAAQMPKYQAPTLGMNITPPVDIGQTIGMFQDIQIKNAQLDNMKKQNELMDEDLSLKKVLNEFAWDKAKAGLVNSQQSGIIKMLEAGYKGNTTEFTGGAFTPWQQGQIEALNLKNKNLKAVYESLMANSAKAKAGTEYTRVMTDFYTGRAIMNMIGQGVGALKNFTGMLMPKYIPKFRK